MVVAEEKDIFRMTRDGRVYMERDRLSDLPRNVVDCILELLPAQDAARTSILSKKWRYNWAMLPYLVLDGHFCNSFVGDSQSFIQTVDTILLQHLGAIVKFYLDVSSESTNIDRWMLFVTRNGVKELHLCMPDEADNTYKLPSCVFNCRALTHLTLFNCVFRPPTSFVHLQNLTTLHLQGITFEPTAEHCVINVPLVVHLNIFFCDVTQYLKVFAPKLESLGIYDVHYLLLNSFMSCQNLRELCPSFELTNNMKHYERISLEKLLFSLSPTLEQLTLDSVCLELLSAGTVSQGPPLTFNRLWHLELQIDFSESSDVSCALQFIKSVPHLSKLKIEVIGTSNCAEVKWLNTPSSQGRPLDKLKYVVIQWFMGSKAEFLFLKLLLACTPSLVRMCIENIIPINSEKTKMTRELMCFPKASPKAELIMY